MSLREKIVDAWDRGPGEKLGYFKVDLADPRPAADGGESETVLAVPGYYQAQTYTCGFTAGLMVLHTFHPRRSPDRFLQAVAPDPEWGTPTNRLIRALRDHRVGVSHIRKHTFETVAKRIEAGEPIVTVTNNGRSYNHWVVLFGVARGPVRMVYVAANGLPYISRARYPWEKFERIWRPREGAFSCWGT